MRQLDTLSVYEKVYNRHGLAIAEYASIYKEIWLVEATDLFRGDEWLIEYSPFDSPDGKEWHPLFADSYFSFENANRCLCELVSWGTLAVEDYDIKYLNSDSTSIANVRFQPINNFLLRHFSTGKEEIDISVGYSRERHHTYTIRFNESAVHFRIRSIATDEIIPGEALGSREYE